MHNHQARLAQLVERKALNLLVVGLSPTVGVSFLSLLDITFCFSNEILKFKVYIQLLKLDLYPEDTCNSVSLNLL